MNIIRSCYPWSLSIQIAGWREDLLFNKPGKFRQWLMTAYHNNNYYSNDAWTLDD